MKSVSNVWEGVKYLFHTYFGTVVATCFIIGVLWLPQVILCTILVPLFIPYKIEPYTRKGTKEGRHMLPYLNRRTRETRLLRKMQLKVQ